MSGASPKFAGSYQYAKVVVVVVVDAAVVEVEVVELLGVTLRVVEGEGEELSASSGFNDSRSGKT